jgi:hypothetical protein
MADAFILPLSPHVRTQDVCWALLGCVLSVQRAMFVTLTSSDAGSGSFSGLRGGDHRHM